MLTQERPGLSLGGLGTPQPADKRLVQWMVIQHHHCRREDGLRLGGLAVTGTNGSELIQFRVNAHLLAPCIGLLSLTPLIIQRHLLDLTKGRGGCD